jgi:hypothetical protein
VNQIREGMAVFDSTGKRAGRVEALRSGHFFLTRETLIPLVQERIVVDAALSVASVDADGVHLRHDRQELLTLNARPRDAQSSHQVAPGEDISAVHRGDEDRRPLDHDDVRAQRLDREGRGDTSPMSS